MRVKIVLFQIIFFLLIAPAHAALIYPSPRVSIDRKLYGDSDRNPAEKRRYIIDFMKKYIEQYVAEFLSSNKLSENRFPKNFADNAILSIRLKTDKEIFAMSFENVDVLKAFLDQTARGLYELPIDTKNEAAKLLESYDVQNKETIAALETKMLEADSRLRAEFEQNKQDFDQRIQGIQQRADQISSQQIGLKDKTIDSGKGLAVFAIALSLVNALLLMRRR